MIEIKSDCTNTIIKIPNECINDKLSNLINDIIKETIKLELINKYTELINLLNNKFTISYGELVYSDINLLLSFLWIIKYYINKEYYFYLPKVMLNSIGCSISIFNETIIKNSNYFLNDSNILPIDLENLLINNNFNKDTVIIFGCYDTSFQEIYNINKRRLNTQINKIINKTNSTYFVGVLPIIRYLDIPCISNYKEYCLQQKPEINFSNITNYSSIIDDIDENDSESIDSLVDFIVNNLINTNEINPIKLFTSLDLSVKTLKYIESLLVSNNINVYRKHSNELLLSNTNNNHESTNKSKNVIINSSITTKSNKSLLLNYDIYIIKLPEIKNPIDLLYYCSFIGKNATIYFDEYSNNIIEKYFKTFNNNTINNPITINPITIKFKVKDSSDFETYEECLLSISSNTTNNSIICATEYYFKLESNTKIKKMDLSNLSKLDNDYIRSYVKILVNNKLGSEYKTCQMSSPSSPLDRSKKINSLSNKLNSLDYRCDITCEIFKDYSIGVVVWNDFFRDRKNELNNLIDVFSNYIYQTTAGKWKISL